MNAPERRESGARRGNRDRTMEGAMSFPLMGCQRSDINSRPHATVEFIGSRFNFIPPANRSSTLRIDPRSIVALVDRGICNGKENDDAFQLHRHFSEIFPKRARARYRAERSRKHFAGHLSFSLRLSLCLAPRDINYDSDTKGMRTWCKNRRNYVRELTDIAGHDFMSTSPTTSWSACGD